MKLNLHNRMPLDSAFGLLLIGLLLDAYWTLIGRVLDKLCAL